MMSFSTVILLAIVVVVFPAVQLGTVPSSSSSTSRLWTISSSSSPTSRLWTSSSSTSNPWASTFYMDGNCYGYSNYVSDGDTVVVKAWSSPPQPFYSTSCTLYFTSLYDMTYSMQFGSSSHINDCSTSLKIYASSAAYGTPAYSYSCYSTMPYYVGTVTDNGYLTIALNRASYQDTNFDFTLTITGNRTPHYYYPISWTIGWSIGGAALFAIVISLVIVVRRRRLALRYARLTGGASSNYGAVVTSYPAGYAPYPAGNGYPAGAVAPPPYSTVPTK